jgi:hypothetical protein
MAEQLSIGVPVADLRPTQMTVGFREVEIKRRQWREADEEARTTLLRRHVVPAVIGPKGRLYIVDHHHFTKSAIGREGLGYRRLCGRRPRRFGEGGVLEVVSVQRELVSGRTQLAQTHAALGHDCLPLRQRGGASLFVDFAADEVALLAEMVVD